MAPKGILDYRSVQLTDHGPAGGTNGARIALDPEGTRWLVKHYQGNPDRVATELLANAIYRELEILVPEAGIGHLPGPGGTQWIAAAYPMLEGKPRTWSEPNAALAEGFVADALLANWDVIGQVQDNILWTDDDTPIRIDQGGCLRFRAQGITKDYGPEVDEIESMLGKKGQARGRMAVTADLVTRKAAEAASVLTPDRIEALVSDAPFEDLEMKAEVEASLKARVEHLSRIAGS